MRGLFGEGNRYELHPFLGAASRVETKDRKATKDGKCHRRKVAFLRNKGEVNGRMAVNEEKFCRESVRNVGSATK